MARLNEPAPAAETMDSLKRKFMRQNRDIARANSAQGLRIRSLENETSRLLAENLGLQEQIIRLRREIDEGKARQIVDQTIELKAQLEEKLREIGALVSGLGLEPSRKKSEKGGKNAEANVTKSPEQKNWKNTCSLSDALANQEGRLPPILENKYYPRRTLERQEILEIVEADTTDSPEIGPPPMSQFVDEDPVKIDLPRRTRSDDNEELPGLDPALSINLEQRKKRKDSIAPVEPLRAVKLDRARETGGSLKIGAKRKLSVREDEEQGPDRSDAVSPDDFKYTRVAAEDRRRVKSTSQNENSNSRVSKETANNKVKGSLRESNPVITGRKVLAPKSVNDSPRKNRKPVITDEVKLIKADGQKSSLGKEAPDEKQKEPVQIPQEAPPTINIATVQPEPETPAAVDMFSPPSTHPSTARAESRDTPPPQELEAGSEGHRPSRRARASVSYAEPNLRDKMRRPTKELADAVSRDEKLNIPVKVEGEGTAKTTRIKSEAEVEDGWKNMPLAPPTDMENSPLSHKTADPVPESLMTHKKRRESILHSVETEPSKSSSESAMLAMLAENRKAKAAAREKAMVEQAALANAISKLDIYEFRGSSPNSEGKGQSEKPSAPIAEQKGTKTSRSRRHTREHQEENEASDKEGPVFTRRRQSTLGLRNSTTQSDNFKSHIGERTLKKSSSSTAMVDGPTGESRSDRIAARRRSMMV